jgi:hypothetical protein
VSSNPVHRWGVLDTTLCDKVCQWLATDLCSSPGTPVASTNKTDRHDITEILLKVALNIINQNKTNPSIYQVDINRHNAFLAKPKNKFTKQQK